MEINFIVYGEPKALKRHRMYRHGGRLISVNPSSKDEDDFLILAHSNKPEKPIDVPVFLEAGFYFGRPKSHFKAGKNCNLLKPNAPFFHRSRPDIDNLIKFIMDSLNNVFWADDKIIYNISASKKYDDNPRTEIKVIW